MERRPGHWPAIYGAAGKGIAAIGGVRHRRCLAAVRHRRHLGELPESLLALSILKKPNSRTKPRPSWLMYCVALALTRGRPGVGASSAYGRALADNGNFQQAFDTLTRAHTPADPDWRILSVQGTTLDQMGKHDEARRYYGSALKIAPGMGRVNHVGAGASWLCLECLRNFDYAPPLSAAL